MNVAYRKNETTERTTELHLYATSAADEIFISRMTEVFRTSTGRVRVEFETPSGKIRRLTWDPAR